MQLQQPFDARSVEPSSFPAPPRFGDYHVQVVNSEPKPTKDNSGGFIEFTLEILDPGEYFKRQVPYRLNLFNNSDQAVRIAYAQLSALCYVTGVFQVQDTRQLHSIPFIATIGPQKNDPQFANVFGVKDLNGNAPGKPAGGAAAPTAAAPAPPAPAQPAWAAPAPTPPPQAQPAPQPAWGAPQPPQPPQPPAQPAWAAPAAPAPPAQPAAPAWQPPAPPAAAAAPAPAWQPNAAPATPPWGNR